MTKNRHCVKRNIERQTTRQTDTTPTGFSSHRHPRRHRHPRHLSNDFPDMERIMRVKLAEKFFNFHLVASRSNRCPQLSLASQIDTASRLPHSRPAWH
ncbi:hypothetical protein E2C01_019415 [Portunus trituberculatus]|uniref:Uncharacterized protein n=1 Tax=Portunus trituberculatus TaxID=210409 RepID=A0A5B7DYT8_PORTR|nr:hypothetical protein [Portunus trituberculatus]